MITRGRGHTSGRRWSWRALDDPALLAASLNRVGNWQVNTVQPAEALALHREALAIFERLDDRRGIAETLDLLGMASYLSADLDGCIAWYERAVAQYHELDDRRGLVTSLAMLACRAFDWLTADPAAFAQGAREAEEAVSLARTIEWPAGEGFALFQLAIVLGYRGEYAQALELAERSLHVAEQIGHHQWLAGAHYTLGTVYLLLHALSAARQHLEQGLALARALGSTFWVQLTSGALAWEAVLTRDLDRAEAILDDPSLPDTAGPSIGNLWCVHARARLALARGEPARALVLLDQVGTPTRDGLCEHATTRLALAHGEVLTALGRHAEAERVLRSLEETTRRQGVRPYLWRAHVALGNLYRTGGRDEDARHEFAAARTIVEELASDVPEGPMREEFLQNTTALMPRGYRRSPLSTAAARSRGLTAREREVAALVAQGKTNREIADALVLGPRTVQTHVGSMLTKLGLTSRRQLARWLRDQYFAERND